MHSNEDFMREITSTPSHDYAWIYYGTVMIAREGVYTFCSTSDDGSMLIVDDKKLVDNDGLHGAQQRCAATKLSTGKHTVAVKGFQAGGGAYQTATYAGPDTEGVARRMVSVATKPPELPPPSEWEMRIYKTSFSPFEVGSAVESVGSVGSGSVGSESVERP